MEKTAIKGDVFDVFSYVSATSNYSITYFHTGLGKMNKGPLTSFKKLFAKYDLERQQRLMNLNMIQPGFYLKARLSVMRCAVNNLLLRKCQTYDNILTFFESIRTDTVLTQRIIGALPNEIHQVYLAEREHACKLLNNT